VTTESSTALGSSGKSFKTRSKGGYDLAISIRISSPPWWVTVVRARRMRLRQDGMSSRGNICRRKPVDRYSSASLVLWSKTHLFQTACSEGANQRTAVHISQKFRPLSVHCLRFLCTVYPSGDRWCQSSRAPFLSRCASKGLCCASENCGKHISFMRRTG
jgi:hypothetical protein